MEIDPNKIIAEASVAAAKEIAKGAGTAVVAGTKSLWSWIRGKAPASAAADLDAAAAAPEKPSAALRIQTVLTDLLQDQPGLAKELADVLAAHRAAQPIALMADVKGDNNVVVQPVGTGHTVTINR